MLSWVAWIDDEIITAYWMVVEGVLWVNKQVALVDSEWWWVAWTVKAWVVCAVVVRNEWLFSSWPSWLMVRWRQGFLMIRSLTLWKQKIYWIDSLKRRCVGLVLLMSIVLMRKVPIGMFNNSNCVQHVLLAFANKPNSKWSWDLFLSNWQSKSFENVSSSIDTSLDKESKKWLELSVIQ